MNLVTVITPTANRPTMLRRAIINFLEQDYPNKEMIIIYERTSDIMSGQEAHDIGAPYKGNWYITHEAKAGTIGLKRNYGCSLAQGNIILHMDDDDYYAPDWISKSVAALGDNDLTGINKAFFYRPHTHLWEYDHSKNTRYVIGASMCYRKSMWERNKFREDVRYGEDAYFCKNGGHIQPHDYQDGFCAILHGTNTCSHTQTFKMTPLVPDYAKYLLKDRYHEYGN